MTASISTHVLDTERGEPASGLLVELRRGEELLSAQLTNDDGRIPDLVQGSLEPGSYELVFHSNTRFFSRIALEITIEDAERHYHVPLLVSPYSCTTYRGS